MLAGYCVTFARHSLISTRWASGKPALLPLAVQLRAPTSCFAGTSHRDLKPENVLLSSQSSDANIKIAVRLSDYSLSSCC